MDNEYLILQEMGRIYWKALGRAATAVAGEKQHEQKETDRFCSYLHEEVSEMFGHWRDGRAPDDLFYSQHGTKPDGIPAELADIVLRIADWCDHNNIDLADAITQKHEYNKKRPPKHGREHS